MSSQFDTLIVGSGPAGYTAALYCIRSGMNVALITGLEIGGQLTTTTDVDNWPGEQPNVQGPELMERMRQQLIHYNCKFINEHIEAITVNSKESASRFTVKSQQNTHTCKALIVATGSTAKYLGMPSEKEYLGKGVSTCATCDGFFHRNNEVIVIGGGNTAAEEALYLSNIAKKVHLVHRRDEMRAEHMLSKKIQEQSNIQIHWSHVLDEVLGDDLGVVAAKIKSVANNNTTELKVSGVFVAIGHTPNTDFLKGHAELDANGYLIVGQSSKVATMTSVEGMFAAGDVADPIYRQAISSAGTGCMAALDAFNWLS